jgi:calcium-dependent protein kinase
VASSQCAVRERYEVGAQPLGIGTSGSVHKCWHRVTGAAYAVKTISKVRVKDVDHLKREIAIMAMLDHPNIVKLIETFEDRRSIYLVMELCAGGELLDALAQVNQFSEVQAATLMRQILRGIYYMHESNTCHGDLKPDNIMFSTQGSIGASILKIIDFGLSCRLGEASHRRAKGSTPYYTAPEALSGHCSKEGDLWSCGAIMFTMLCGRPPFSGETKEDVIFSIRRGSFSFPRGRISENGQDLVRKLMKLNPCKRYSAEQALNHVWLQERALPEDEVELPSDFIENLREFRQAGQMKKLVLNIIPSPEGGSLAGSIDRNANQKPSANVHTFGQKSRWVANCCRNQRGIKGGRCATRSARHPRRHRLRQSWPN